MYEKLLKARWKLERDRRAIEKDRDDKRERMVM